MSEEKPAQFSRKDQEVIVGILSNQPLQNLAAADGLRGLIARFVDFTNRQFDSTSAMKEATPVRRGTYENPSDDA